MLTLRQIEVIRAVMVTGTVGVAQERRGTIGDPVELAKPQLPRSVVAADAAGVGRDGGGSGNQGAREGGSPGEDTRQIRE